MTLAARSAAESTDVQRRARLVNLRRLATRHTDNPDALASLISAVETLMGTYTSDPDRQPTADHQPQAPDDGEPHAEKQATSRPRVHPP